MKRMMRLLASFLLLMGTFSLLVADSAMPRCNRYEGFAISYEYDTNCDLPVRQGTIRFALQDGNGFPETELNQKVLDAWKQVVPEIKSFRMRWDHNACFGEKKDQNNPARAYSFSFTIEIPQGDQNPIIFNCEEAGHAGENLFRDITLVCNAYNEGIDACDFSFRWIQ